MASVAADNSLAGRLTAENAVIGAMLIDETTVSPILAAVNAADICNPDNRRIFQAARALMLDGLPVDPVTIRDKLGQGIEERLIQLMEITPTSANWREYAEIVRQQAALERIRAIASELVGAVNVDDCRERIAALGELMATGQGVDAWSMKDAYQYFMAAQGSETKREYISYGIRELDEGTYTEPGDVVVIGGEPSSGKTAFALALAYHMAKTHNVGFFSLETGQKKLTERLVSTVLGLDFNVIKRQQLTEDDWQTVAEGGQEFTARRLTLLRGSGMTATQIQTVSKAYGFDVIFVDYVQLVRPETDPRAGSVQAVAAISMSLHTFAQSSGTLVVELAQLVRPQKQVGWREPTMHDLKETGQLEQDADMVMLLYKPGPKDCVPGSDEPLDPAKSRILKIDKQKEGQLCHWPMHFDGAHQRFSVMAGPDGQSIMRRFSSAGKAAKMKPRAQSPGQIGLREISPRDPDCPWPERET